MYRNVIGAIASIAPREQKPSGDESESSRPAPTQAGTIIVVSGSESALPLKIELGSPARNSGSTGTDDPFVRLFAVAGWCAFLSAFGPLVLNIPFRFNPAFTNAMTYGDLDELERMAVLAISRNLTLLVTLSNGKFYVGFPLETSQDGSSETKWIIIQPLASGHRPASGKLEITTAYSPLYEEIDGDESERMGRKDFRVAIPVPNIASVQFFDLDLYERHFGREDEDCETNEEDLSAAIAAPQLGAGNGAEGEPSQVSGAVQQEMFDQASVRPAFSPERLGDHKEAASRLRLLALVYAASASAAVVALPFSTPIVVVSLLLTAGTGLTLFKPTEHQLAGGSPYWRWIAKLRVALLKIGESLSA